MFVCMFIVQSTKVVFMKSIRCSGVSHKQNLHIITTSQPMLHHRAAICGRVKRNDIIYYLTNIAYRQYKKL